MTTHNDDIEAQPALQTIRKPTETPTTDRFLREALGTECPAAFLRHLATAALRLRAKPANG